MSTTTPMIPSLETIRQRHYRPETDAERLDRAKHAFAEAVALLSPELKIDASLSADGEPWLEGRAPQQLVNLTFTIDTSDTSQALADLAASAKVVAEAAQRAGVFANLPRCDGCERSLAGIRRSVRWGQVFCPSCNESCNSGAPSAYKHPLTVSALPTFDHDAQAANAIADLERRLGKSDPTVVMVKALLAKEAA